MGYVSFREGNPEIISLKNPRNFEAVSTTEVSRALASTLAAAAGRHSSPESQGLSENPGGAFEKKKRWECVDD